MVSILLDVLFHVFIMTPLPVNMTNLQPEMRDWRTCAWTFCQWLNQNGNPRRHIVFAVFFKELKDRASQVLKFPSSLLDSCAQNSTWLYNP